MKRLFIGFGLLVTIVLLGREALLLPNGKLQVRFLAVDQGDATLVVTPTGKQILIDGGPNLSVLEHLGRYTPFFDRSIDLIILSHPDSDHLTALPEVLRRYQMGPWPFGWEKQSPAFMPTYLMSWSNKQFRLFRLTPVSKLPWVMG